MVKEIVIAMMWATNKIAENFHDRINTAVKGAGLILDNSTAYDDFCEQHYVRGEKVVFVSMSLDSDAPNVGIQYMVGKLVIHNNRLGVVGDEVDSSCYDLEPDDEDIEGLNISWIDTYEYENPMMDTDEIVDKVISFLI